MPPPLLYPRYLLPRLREALADTPTVLIHGTRQCGKTTLARMVGDEYDYRNFDDDNLLAAARRDPVGFVDLLPRRVIIDEIQRAPELFTSLKLAVDRQRQPGRFLLTGSANLMLLPQVTDSLAGRIEVLRLHPLAQCEIEGSTPGFLGKLFSQSLGGMSAERLRGELVERIVRGGFPEPQFRTSPVRRRHWYRNYIEALIQRDIRDIARISEPEAIPKLLRMLANHSACLANISELAKAFQLTRPTIEHYVAILRRIFLVDFLQPWHSNRNSRLIKTPKVHLTDAGLACTVLGCDEKRLSAEPALLGQLAETFVYTELQRQAGWGEHEYAFFHYRDKDQYEVDLVIENEMGDLVGIEVKVAATVRSGDFKGLRRLQRAAGGRMCLGVLLYDGTDILPFGDGLLAVPMRSMWES